MPTNTTAISSFKLNEKVYSKLSLSRKRPASDTSFRDVDQKWTDNGVELLIIVSSLAVLKLGSVVHAVLITIHAKRKNGSRSHVKKFYTASWHCDKQIYVINIFTCSSLSRNCGSFIWHCQIWDTTSTCRNGLSARVVGNDRSLIGHLPATCRPLIGHLPVTCRLPPLTTGLY